MRGKLGDYFWSVVIVAAGTGVAQLLVRHIAPTNLVMIYLLCVLFVAARFGRGPAVLTSLLSVAAFDFVFVPPLFSFAVDDAEYLVTLLVMLIVALFTSGLMLRVRRQAEAAQVREVRTSALYLMSREFSRALDRAEIVRIAEEKTGDLLGADVWVFLPDANGVLEPAPGVMSRFPLVEAEMHVAQWVFLSGRPAGFGTELFSEANAYYVPIAGMRGRAGVLGVFEHARARHPEGAQLLDGIAGQLALALERDVLAGEAHLAKLQLEADRLRETLLRSVSHDFRTPLATIAGAASGLMGEAGVLDERTRRDMAQSIWEEAERLNRFVSNLLRMTRLESGALRAHKEWHPVEEVVGSALTVLKRRLGNQPIHVRAPDNLPLVLMDGILIEQVLVNLIENAVRHAGPDSPIEIEASLREGAVVISVADRGHGIAAGTESQVFEKAGHAAPNSANAGIGLGLRICRGIVEAHGGRIWAANREGGGALFAFALPVGESAPEPMDEALEAREAADGGGSFNGEADAGGAA